MAVKQVQKSESICPKCNKELLIKEGKIIKWLSCPDCKFKKLTGKSEKERGVKVTPLR